MSQPMQNQKTIIKNLALLIKQQQNKKNG